VVLIGDTNIDLFKQGSKRENYLEVLESSEMTQHVRRATRNCGTSSTLIDHIISSNTVKLDKIANSNVHISDHHLIGCRLQSFGLKVKPKIQYQRCKVHTVGLGYDFSKCDYQRLSEKLLQTDWTNFHSSDEVEVKWHLFKTILLECISETTPKFACKCGKRLNNKKCNKPWYTTELTRLKQNCDSAYRHYCTNGKTQFLYDIYKRERRIYNSHQKRTRAQYYKNLVENATSYKQKWAALNQIRGKAPTGGSDINEILNSQNELLTDKNEIAETINSFFAKIGAKTLESVTEAAIRLNVPSHTFPRNSPSNSFHFRPPTLLSVQKAIAHLKNNKPSGPMGVPAELIKRISPAILNKLTALFKVFIDAASLPGEFKDAHVTPIYKEGDKTNPSNYRPISVTSAFSKIFEQTLLAQVLGHLERFSVLAPSQYGFRRNHSTVHAIIDSLEYAFTELNAKCDKFVSFLYLDLSKAFDCIDHERLKQSLDAIGFDDSSTKMITEMLSNRRQYVKLDDITSDAALVNCGIAQGSQMGPVIFSIFVNDCYRMLSNSHTKIVQYADDVCLITSGDSKNCMIERTEQNLLGARNYFISIGLKLNVSKTQYVPATNAEILREDLLLSTLNPTASPDDQIKAQGTAKYLGLIIDSKLCFRNHKEKVLSKLKSIHALVRSIRNKLSPNSAKLLYNTLFLSTHDYGAVAFNTVGYGTAEINEKMEVMHRKMIRCVYRLSWELPNNELYETTGLSSLLNRRDKITAKLVHQCIFKTAPILMQAYIERSATTARAYEEYRVKVPNPIRTNLLKNSFSYRGASLWNTLPSEIRSTESMGRFRTAVMGAMTAGPRGRSVATAN
jgi:hypothetical protein